MVIKCQLLAQENDLGYTTYVFENLEPNPTFGYRYIMVTRFPNWDHRELELGEIGFLHYESVVAGVDKYWDGSKLVPYNYTNNIFMK